MTNPTLDEWKNMASGAASLSAWLSRIVAAMTPNYASLTYAVHDMPVHPGATYVDVPVELTQAANQTQVLKYLTANGSVNEGSYFIRTQGYLVFQPGERVKTVRIPLLHSFASGDYFTLTVAWPQNSPVLQKTKQQATITGDTSVVDPGLTPDDCPLPPMPDGATIFSEDFTAFTATDSGYDASGAPCWRARLQHGYEQVGNKEYGAYVNPEHNQGVTPWVMDANGFRLQSEYQPNGVLLANGSQAICSWSGTPYLYSAPVITTEKLPSIRTGDYFEAQITIPQATKSWPAFWLLPKDGSWPSIELDIFEGFFTSTPTKDDVGTTVHWKNDSGNASMFSARDGQTGLDLSQPHIWGCHWGNEQVVFYLDNEPYFSFPNIFPAKDCYLLLNIAVGGNPIGAPPADGSGWPVQMPVQFVRIIRP